MNPALGYGLLALVFISAIPLLCQFVEMTGWVLRGIYDLFRR